MFIWRKKVYDKNLTREEKEKMTSFAYMSRNNKIVEDYDHWYITKNDYPYDNAKEHYVIRAKDYYFRNSEIHSELYNIMRTYVWKWFILLANPEKRKSVSREHYHLILY